MYTPAMESALDYSCHAIATSQIDLRFNIAFVQIRLVQQLYTLSES